MKSWLYLLILSALLGVLAQERVYALHKCPTSTEGFLAFGDSGMGNSGQKAVAEAMSTFCEDHECQWVALLGDNIYPNGVDSVDDPQWKTKFEQPYQDLEIPFYPCLGNHDYFGDVNAQFEYASKNSRWKFPGRYYRYSTCLADFFVIDAEKWDEEQEGWLREQLVLSMAPWKIVYGHRPIFSHGGHGDTKTLKNKLLPILEGKVDFYLSGHDHHLEYISKGVRPDFIISGAAAENRTAGKGKSTLFTGNEIGFVHIQMKPESALVTYMGTEGEPLFTHEKKH